MRPVALCFPRGIDSGSRFESLRPSTLECMEDTANSMIRSTRVLTNVRQRQEDKTACIGKSEDRSRGGGETIRDRRSLASRKDKCVERTARPEGLEAYKEVAGM